MTTVSSRKTSGTQSISWLFAVSAIVPASLYSLGGFARPDGMTGLDIALATLTAAPAVLSGLAAVVHGDSKFVKACAAFAMTISVIVVALTIGQLGVVALSLSLAAAAVAAVLLVVGIGARVSRRQART